MSNIPTRVAIVVDSDFSALLEDLAGRMHVWLVDTPPNHAVAEKLWALGSGSRSRGVTIFEVDASLTPDSWVEDILSAVDEHHGLREEWATDVELEIRGVSVTDRIRVALQELGSFLLEEREDGFVARRTPGATEGLG